MRKEIGSEFFNVPVCEKENRLFPYNTSYFLSGRSALYYIIKDILSNNKVKTVALPSWCCDSIITPFLEFNIDVKFYPVIWHETLMCDFSEVEDCDILFIMDYFGYDCNFAFDGFNRIVIRDLTHSVFTKNYNDAHYFFGSLRKWAGFLTGGFAWKKEGNFKEVDAHSLCESYISLRKKAMKDKREYIFGTSESKDYLDIFNKAENMLENSTYSYCHKPHDIEKLKYLDTDYIKKKRRENALYLLSGLKSIAMFPELKENDCPLFVPVIIKNGKRDALKNYLLENQIYSPVHWPVSKFHKLKKEEKNIYDNELSIVCDQRYDKDDMQRILNVITNFMEG